MITEELLYRGCLNGDNAIQQTVFRQYLPLMHGTCLRYVQHAEEADDLVQEGFIKVFSNVDKFSYKGEGSFVAWMKRIVVNTAINHYHKNVKNKHLSYDELDVAECSSRSGEDLFEIIRNAGVTDSHLVAMIQELPEQFRVVFNLFAVENYSHHEIAEMLNIPKNTSLTRYSRAKEKLKKTILQAVKKSEVM